MLKWFKKIKKEEAGFTLVEMAIVILIIAMLLLIIIPNIGKVEQSASKTSGDAIVQTVETQMVIYRIDNDMSPNAGVSLEDLEKDGYITTEQLRIYREHE